MEPTTHHATPKSHGLDLTGLNAEQQQIVETLVAHFRSQPKVNTLVTAPYEEWAQAFRTWLDSHPRRQTLADDSRESIYAGRGE
jgi:hypothetical protein